MEQIYRFTDLDNTILYSKRYGSENKTLVECIDGKEQGYIPNAIYDMLQKCNREEIIPVTSRHLGHYERISFFMAGGCPKYALIDNGGILLVDGIIDEEWEKVTHEITSGQKDLFDKYASVFKSCAEVTLQDKLVYYVKNIEEETWNNISEKARREGLLTYSHGKKHYFTFASLNKGNSIRRFFSRFGKKYALAVGDSEIDFSMAEAVNEAYFDERIKNQYKGKDKNVFFVSNNLLAEKIFK